MERVVLDFGTVGKLTASSRPIEICNEVGTVVGVFLKAAKLKPQISDAEIDRRIRETGDEFSTREVLDHLESL